MNDLLEFLTSKEIVIVYIIAGIACLSCFIYYLVEKNNVKRRLKNNTRELNKLVEEIKDEVPLDDKPIYNEPILQVVEEKSSVGEMLDSTKELNNNNEAIRDEVLIDPLAAEIEQKVLEQTASLEPINISKEDLVVNKEDGKITVEEPDLEYTSIEPDPETAKIELQKITEELRRQEEMASPENIKLTEYEEEQEENAIISLQELVAKSKDLYLQNELSQYADEGNEPISLNELDNSDKNKENYEEPFILKNVVPEEELQEIDAEEVVEDNKTTINLNDMNLMNKEVNTNKKFQSSPIISPIYGIENKEELVELENTADYDKLDSEIKKTNEFLMTLKELQKKLD